MVDIVPFPIRNIRNREISADISRTSQIDAMLRTIVYQRARLTDLEEMVLLEERRLLEIRR